MWRGVILIATCALWGVNSAKAAEQHGGASYSYSYSSPKYDDKGSQANHHNDYDNYVPDFGFGFNFVDPYVFHQQLTADILAQNAAHQNAIASTFTSGDAMVQAGASNSPNEGYNFAELINRQQAALFDNIRRQSQHNYDANQDNHYMPNYAAAAASIGPEGGYQSAFIRPENPDIPNVSNRFSASSPDGFKGISVSSYSSSSNVNGKTTSHRGAEATINDNGRITTYKVNS